MTPVSKQQALTLVCEVRSESQRALRAELSLLASALEEAFRSLPSLHFARFVVIPARAASEELVLELGFEGALEPLLVALWAIAGGYLIRVFRYCHSTELPADGRSFSRFCARHARRADAAFAAHDGLSVAVIHNDVALDRLLQAELDRAVEAEAVAEHGPLEIATTLQSRARANHGTWLGSVGREQQRRDPLAPVRGRLAEVLLSLLVLPLLAFGQALSGLFRRTRVPVGEGADSLLLREQGPCAQLLRLKPGRSRLRVVRLLLWLIHGWVGQRASGLGPALSHVHSARWLILEGSRLLFLAHTDLGPGALLPRRSAWERRLSALIWLQAEGFPSGLRAVLGGDRREAALREWLRRSLLPTAFWYTAYPGLSVSEIERNHRVRELLGRNIDRERALELCALL
ncbi:MAG TPA: hypothetical protein VG937_21785 [Polyangiaceae bacterium]|jgi:hypothetical protein|nr:hypothetical protein [Polyangiaceae bacterium]